MLGLSSVHPDAAFSQCGMGCSIRDWLMKRFTQTSKWSDPWFRRLSSGAKMLWFYLLDNCDSIGLVEIDFAFVSTDCGQPIKEKHLAELGDRIQPLGSGKLFIPKFIHFQYGQLTPNCPPHRTIIKLVETHGLIQDGVNYRYPSNTLISSIGQPVDPVRVDIPLRQDKNGQEKEKEGGMQGGKAPSLEAVKLHASKSGLPESEAIKFHAHYESNGWRVGKNPMRSWSAAMTNWKINYEQRIFQNGGSNNSGRTRPATGAEQRQVGIPEIDHGINTSDLVEIQQQQLRKEREQREQAAKDKLATEASRF